MAQGTLKKPNATKPTTAHKSSATSRITKKYLAVKPSKNAKAAKAAKMNKKFTAGLTAQTERMLGERAGHLEMIGKGRKKGGSGVGEGEKGKHGKRGGEGREGRKG